MFIASSEPDVYESDGGGGVDVTERINICIISRQQDDAPNYFLAIEDVFCIPVIL